MSQSTDYPVTASRMNGHSTLPPEAEMYRAVERNDSRYDGVFYVAVQTTGIFCRPSCAARTPLRANVEFVADAREALLRGYRACLRCRPLEPAGAAPAWLRPLLARVEEAPTRRWRDRDLRSLGVEPARARRWFRKHHGMTFHAYQRARRLGAALGHLRSGGRVTEAAFSHGWESLSAFHDAFRDAIGTTPGRAEDGRVVRVHRILSPLGPMLAGATDEGLCLLEFVDRRMLAAQIRTVARALRCTFVPGANGVIEHAEAELRAYFEGRLTRFTVPLATPGTDFQRRAWNALLDIPYGETRSYADQAEAIGQPTAVRAVARANGANRVAVIVPCHRVIGKDGRLSGYGGGVWRKRRLLELEARAAAS
jgi:AraC family transcriptional regulator of adaptative response/methylated-DNA-[protein]-cysteine methyltransferase